jgi:hypothetical protein
MSLSETAAVSKEKQVDILYDHYKDSFDHIKGYLQKRFSYTLIIIGVVAAFAFDVSFPGTAQQLSVVVIKKKIGDIRIDFRFINDVVAFGLMWVLILYYQINLLIENQYNYIQRIEKQLSDKLTDVSIDREGYQYLQNYPLLLKVTHRIYTILFPLTVITVVAIKWFQDTTATPNQIGSIYFWLETSFLFVAILISILYFFNRHFNDFKKTDKVTRKVTPKK